MQSFLFRAPARRSSVGDVHYSSVEPPRMYIFCFFALCLLLIWGLRVQVPPGIIIVGSARLTTCGRIAQSVEHWSNKPLVVGFNPHCDHCFVDLGRVVKVGIRRRVVSCEVVEFLLHPRFLHGPADDGRHDESTSLGSSDVSDDPVAVFR